jgi:hypothetical protein
MKKRLLAFAATLAILGGSGAVAMSQVLAQTPPSNTVQSQPQPTVKNESIQSEANDKGKADNDNVQEGDQHDTTGAPEVPDNQ